MLSLLAANLDSNSTPVLVALIIGFTGVLSTLATPLILGRQRRNDRIREAKIRADEAERRQADKREDWARQDAVRIAAEQVATTLKDSGTRTEHQLARLQKAAAEIHILVNSDMTAARRDEMLSNQRTLKALKRVVAVAKSHGEKPSADDLEAIKVTTERIAELKAILADRAVQQQAVEDHEAIVKEEEPSD